MYKFVIWTNKMKTLDVVTAVSRDVQLSPNNLDTRYFISAVTAPSISTKDVRSLTTKPQEKWLNVPAVH